MIDFHRPKNDDSADVDFIQIKIASPEQIREWSHGEVTKPETINYRSHRPEPMGLFCPRTFGPVKDWECACGKYKRIRFRGVVCDRCGVEVTQSKVRRERMGHIELAVPICHIWFFKTLPSQLGYLLGMTLKDLEKVIYYANYVVTNPGKRKLTRVNQTTEKEEKVDYLSLLTEDEYYDLQVQAKADGDNEFKAEIGAEGVRTLLKQLDVFYPKELEKNKWNKDGKGLDRLAGWLREEIENETSQHRKTKKLRRLKVVEALRHSGPTPEKRNKPEWMVMDVLPVMPPDLRPLVPLPGGRFATSDLNDLYRRVINRNNRLKKLMNMGAPEVILRNEKRMLQESVDALFDNGRRAKALRGRGKRPLKSISDMLKGKQGRFRQNLLGKRVDYSGRSVIVVGPELDLHQCGLPKAMAVELFKPFIIHELEKRGEADTVKGAKKLVEDNHHKVYEVLEDIIRDHPVLLNRAPTLHRIGIQAFEPVLVEGKAIRVHPLVCAAFNADFDGDQMAVHVPLSYEAQLEARVLMLATSNILLPSDGRPVATPSQDMVIGAFVLTKLPYEIEKLEEKAKKDKLSAKEEKELDDIYADAPRFSSYEEVEMALVNGQVKSFRTLCWYLVPASADPEITKAHWVRTNVGRVLFNSIIPDSFGFYNQTFGKKQLGNLVYRCLKEVDMADVIVFLDELKRFGFDYATLGGVSVSVDDLKVPPEMPAMLADANEVVGRFRKAFYDGVISDGERYNKVVDTWTHTTEEVADRLELLLRRSQRGYNPFHMMEASGARGNRDQLRQMAGMRGLMTKPQKKLGAPGGIIESPIRSNFRAGLTVGEYFISTHGARKGLADTALKTAEAGYLTRRLVDVAQDVAITEDDCNTVSGLDVRALLDGERLIKPLADRIAGNVSLEDVYDVNGMLVVRANQLIDDDVAEAIEASGVESVKIRSPLTCESKRGVCRMCYGRNLATMEWADIGEAIGIIAAQSIGEPGTQLTLRTFHIGGTSEKILEVEEHVSDVHGRIILDVPTKIDSIGSRIATQDGQIIVQEPSGKTHQHYVQRGAEILVEDNQEMKPGDVLAKFDPYVTWILTDVDGVSCFRDIKEGRTMRPDDSGRREIIEDREKILFPKIAIHATIREDKKIAIDELPARKEAIENEIAKTKYKKKTKSKQSGSKTNRFKEIDQKLDVQIDELDRLNNELDLTKFTNLARPADRFVELYLEQTDCYQERKTIIHKAKDIVDGRISSATEKIKKMVIDHQTEIANQRDEIQKVKQSSEKTELVVMAQAVQTIEKNIAELNQKSQDLNNKYRAGLEDIVKEAINDVDKLDNPSGRIKRRIPIPAGAFLWENREENKKDFKRIECQNRGLVKAGDKLASVERKVYKTRDITGGLPRIAELFEARKPKIPAIVTEIDGEVFFGGVKRGKLAVLIAPTMPRFYDLPDGKHLKVDPGDRVRKGKKLSNQIDVGAGITGEVLFGGVKQGLRSVMILPSGESKVRRHEVPLASLKVQPGSKVREGNQLSDDDVELVAEVDGEVFFGKVEDGKQTVIIMPVMARWYDVPAAGSHTQVQVRQGERVRAGALLSADVITGIDKEIFSADVITGIGGEIFFGGDSPRMQAIIVLPPSDESKARRYDVPVREHMKVHQGDQVRAVDKLTEGPINPHDILQIKGPRAVQEYLLDEVVRVYDLGNVKINDKHIAVIVKQMLQKSKVRNPGDTHLLQGEHVNRNKLREINEEVRAKGEKPATADPMLIGITKGSLTTDSFVSAASFQETTRVLTDAAVRGARDDLQGLKENIIIGQLIPAGTGVHRNADVDFIVDESYYDDEILPLTEPGESLPGLGADVTGLISEETEVDEDERAEEFAKEMEVVSVEEMAAGSGLSHA